MNIKDRSAVRRYFLRFPQQRNAGMFAPVYITQLMTALFRDQWFFGVSFCSGPGGEHVVLSARRLCAILPRSASLKLMGRLDVSVFKR